MTKNGHDYNCMSIMSMAMCCYIEIASLISSQTGEETIMP